MDTSLKKLTNKYIFLSICLLILLNVCVAAYHEHLAMAYAERLSALSAIGLKENYEDYYKLEAFYDSNSALYSQYTISEWHDVIAGIYKDLDSSQLDNFYAYLDKICAETGIEIAIYTGGDFEQQYPKDMEGVIADRISGLSIDSIRRTLALEGNLLHEVVRDDTLFMSKIIQEPNGEVFTLTFVGDFFSHGRQSNHIKSIAEFLAFDLKSETALSDYYVINDEGEIVLSSQEQLMGIALTIVDAEEKISMSEEPYHSKTYYDQSFSINSINYERQYIFSMPLSDGNQMLVLANKPSYLNYLNKSRFMTLLMTLIGLIAIYFIGNVMVYILENNPLTSRRISMSNRSIRMAMLLLMILVLLNGLGVIQVTRSIFFDEFETEYANLLEGYGLSIQEREGEYRRFVETMINFSRQRARFIHEGIQSFYDVDEIEESNTISSLDSYTYSHVLPQIYDEESAILRAFEKQGHYDFFLGPKLFANNNFYAFYENYVLEPLVGETWHHIYRIDIFPDSETGGYYYFKQDFCKQMRLLDELRYEFDALHDSDDKRPFTSYVRVYNDSGENVVDSRTKSKGNARSGKDILTDKPLWYLYQFKHNTMFRTLEKTIEGVYKEFYNVVYYNQDMEYYFVYRVPKKMIISELESLYNIYVFAIIVLLISVFLTLSIKVNIKKKE